MKHEYVRISGGTPCEFACGAIVRSSIKLPKLWAELFGACPRCQQSPYVGFGQKLTFSPPNHTSASDPKQTFISSGQELA
jgi:hypothetical protein